MVKGRPTKGFGSSSFNYAGKLYKPTPWTHVMYDLKQEAERLVWEELGIDKQFTFCLCGYYGVDGKGIPHHSDTVPTLDDIVVSISLGATRVFVNLLSSIFSKLIPKINLKNNYRDIVLIGFILASFSIAATNGGIGSYPLAIFAAFSLFDIPEDPSIAFGWIMWTSQTIMVIVLGGLSLLFLPIYNRVHPKQTSE